MGLKKFLKRDLNNLFYREYRLNRKVKKYIAPYYSENAPKGSNSKKMIIFMADGRKSHGGLADRLRGIISTFQYCLDHDVEFRIHFVSPFRLENLLQPNEYNWLIADEDISYNSSFSLPVYIDSSHYPEADPAFQRKMAEKYFSKDYTQFHVYTNMYYADDRFGSLFARLFKPASALQQWIDENLQLLGSDFVSLSFRFQNLFGDFADSQTVYSTTEQQELLDRCINQVHLLHQQHTSCAKFLITADSEYFLREVSKLDFVYILPGKIGHMDHHSEQDISVHMKTFLDFFVLSHSSKIYLLVTGKMYKSGFARRAAKISDVPFEEIDF